MARWGLTGAGFRAAEQDHYARQMELFGRADGPIYNVYIRRTNHVTFSDLDLIVRIPDSQLMDIRRAHRIIPFLRGGHRRRAQHRTRSAGRGAMTIVSTMPAPDSS